jgi:hypothetical protein
MENIQSFVQFLIEFIVVVWFLTAIANKPKREELRDRLSNLVTVPTVYSHKDEEIDIDLYPRNSLEGAAQIWRNWFVTPVGRADSTVRSWFQNLQEGIVPDSSHAWKPFNYFILLLLLIGYLYSDAITVASTLVSYGLIDQLDEALKRYDIAILFGSLVSIVIGGIIANDVFGKGEFSDWGLKKDSKWIWFAKITSIFLMISGLYVIASLGAVRYGRLIGLPANDFAWLNGNAQFVINVLTFFNAGLATALIADEGFSKGARILALACISILIILISVIWYIIGAFYGTVVYIIDVLWRFMLGVGNIIFFLALTPLDEAVDLIRSRTRR